MKTAAALLAVLLVLPACQGRRVGTASSSSTTTTTAHQAPSQPAPPAPRGEAYTQSHYIGDLLQTMAVVLNYARLPADDTPTEEIVLNIRTNVLPRTLAEAVQDAMGRAGFVRIQGNDLVVRGNAAAQQRATETLDWTRRDEAQRAARQVIQVHSVSDILARMPPIQLRTRMGPRVASNEKLLLTAIQERARVDGAKEPPDVAISGGTLTVRATPAEQAEVTRTIAEIRRQLVEGKVPLAPRPTLRWGSAGSG